MKDRIIEKIPGRKEGNSSSRIRKEDSSNSESFAERFLFLQRTVGNQAVKRMIRSGTLQAKLKIGKADDKYEKEADRVADHVLRMSEPEEVSINNFQIQRACPSCEESELNRQPIKEDDEEEKLLRQQKEEDEEKLQTKENSASNFEVDHGIENQIRLMKGGGQPLPEGERTFFEPRFGLDFSQVRVHTGAKAAESARAINARAYTVGKDIVFGEGQYAPGTMGGKKLMAHELVHVMQQGGAIRQEPIINREPDTGSGGAGGEKDAEGSESGMGGQRGSGSGTSPPAPAAAAPVGTADITLETGNIGAGFLNNLVHQQICVDRYGQGEKRCFSFAATGAQLPKFSSTWLGWNSLVIGAILKGEVYEPPPVSGATIVGRHTPTTAQGATWLNYMLRTRLGLQDGYSVVRHNCRTFSQWEFRDAPSHW